MTDTIQWAKLSPRERDALVARKIFELNVVQWTQPTQESVDEDGNPITYDLRTGYVLPDKLGSPPVANYTTSMDAAWLVVEKMVGRMGYQNIGFEWNGPIFKSPITYTSSYTNDGPNNHTGHLFYTKAGGDSGALGETCWYIHMTLDGRYWWILADTPQEAICIAALRACGIEVE